MTIIHKTAVVDSKAKIGEDCYIGPYCIIGPNVVLGDRNHLYSNVVIGKNTTIGSDNTISSFAVIGTDPQDLKFSGEETYLIIGSNNSIREFVTINRSNQTEESTVVGDNNLIMTYAHIAHNCQIGNNIVIANAVNMAGHVHVSDFVVIGGVVGIHQFVHIGTHSFIGGMSAIKKDIAPYTRGQGNPYQTVGLNSVGLMRKGFSNDTIAGIKRVYKLFYESNLNTTQAIQAVKKMGELIPEQQVFVEFVNNCDRGLSS